LNKTIESWDGSVNASSDPSKLADERVKLATSFNLIITIIAGNSRSLGLSKTWIKKPDRNP